MEPPLLALIMLVGNDHVNAAASAIAPLRLLAVASEYRRMNPGRRNPGAHEDANAQIGVPPHLRTGHRFSLLGRRSVWERGYVCFGVTFALLFVVICMTAGRGAAEVYWMLRPGAL